MTTTITTDASVFEITPASFAYPKSRDDLLARVRQALTDKQPITPRAGGTSLGGQAIGPGLLLDLSKHFTRILDYRPDEREVDVEPGVIQDDLNALVAKDGLRFAPDTSTSNRAMIAGMIGNNSCGAYSVYYGTTREHVKALQMILADGKEVTIGPLNQGELNQKCQQSDLEGQIYRGVLDLLETHGKQICAAFPDPSIIRRNTGYALDVLYSQHQPFNPTGKPFSLVPLICGSEGTLGVITQATLNLVPLPKYRQVFCAHFDSITKAMQRVPEYLPRQPAAIELIDKATLDGTLNNREQTANRSWVEGDPAGVLVVECFDDCADNLARRLADDQAWMIQQGAYACPIIAPKDTHKVWNLRKAGLGLLMGKPTRKKAVAVIEDACVPVAALPDFYQDTQALMNELELGCVYYGHASVGLIHVRPEIDLASPEGPELFAQVAERSAALVKKYRGALSGEHGDGRIRAPYLKAQFGAEVYACLEQLKRLFDPEHLFNPGVILTDTPITANLRAQRKAVQTFTTGYNWRQDLSLLDAVEKCNGAGACRKSPGQGTMCPSYQATREENYSTRGRSNLLRRALTEVDPRRALNNAELQDALALCLGCKACKTECPASVDMARLKSEVLFQTQPFSLSRWSIKHYPSILRLGAKAPTLFNRLQNLTLTKKIMGVDSSRPLPSLAKTSAQAWWTAQSAALEPLDQQNKSHKPVHGRVWLLVDLYSNYQEPDIGRAAITSLQALQLEVFPIFLAHSPRALLSQGLLDEAKQALLAIKAQLNHVGHGDWIVGLEPSDTLVWRDEAASLLPPQIDSNWFFNDVRLFEELILALAKERELAFKPLAKTLWLHVHCHQKSLAKAADAQAALQLIPELNVQLIPSGCCGMSGEFGYKNREVSLKIAEQTLLPALAKADQQDLIVATGTSCRHQVADFANRQAWHAAQVFALACHGED